MRFWSANLDSLLWSGLDAKFYRPWNIIQCKFPCFHLLKLPWFLKPLSSTSCNVKWDILMPLHWWEILHSNGHMLSSSNIIYCPLCSILKSCLWYNILCPSFFLTLSTITICYFGVHLPDPTHHYLSNLCQACPHSSTIHHCRLVGHNTHPFI